MINNRLHALWHPECYHGWGRKKRFFEGWYYKLVSENQEHALAIIPGIAMDENGEKQAFIQLLDGKSLKELITEIDEVRTTNLSSAIRVYILKRIKN